MKKQSILIPFLLVSLLLQSCGSDTMSSTTASNNATPNIANETATDFDISSTDGTTDSMTDSLQDRAVPTATPTVQISLSFLEDTVTDVQKEDTVDILQNRLDNSNVQASVSLEGNQIIVTASHSLLATPSYELLFQVGSFELRDQQNHLWFSNTNIEGCQIVSMEQSLFTLNISLDRETSLQIATYSDSADTSTPLTTTFSLDGEVLTSLNVTNPIHNGSLQFSGFPEEEALFLNSLLSYPSLPCKLEIGNVTT